MKHVVITGVSTGIGLAAAEELAGHGYHVFGSVRKPKDGAALSQRFGDRFTPLLFDVTDASAIQSAADEVANRLNGQTLVGLVNNSGIGAGGPLMHQPIEEIQRIFDVNVMGVVRTTQAFLPLLGAKLPQTGTPGRIVNIGSVSGKIAMPMLGAYAGSKHALEAISDSLRRELMIYGIDVVLLEPGAIKTPIWDKADLDDGALYKGTDYEGIVQSFRKIFVATGQKGAPAEWVARTIRLALESRNPKARYPMPNVRLQGWLLPRVLPDRWLDRILSKKLGLGRQER
jgi:NAD(P)-dependent dehydrogenase (short-subunit alcohol dehydrogenase family)